MCPYFQPTSRPRSKATGDREREKGLETVSELSTHNPIWDQTRARRTGTFVYEDDEVLIATDFECGNGHRIRKLGSLEYTIEAEPEPGKHQYGGWGYTFCFGVRNKQETGRQIRIRVATPPPEGKTAHDIFARQTGHVVLRRASAFSHLAPANIEPMPEGNAVRLTLDLPACGNHDHVLFVSNFHWHPISELDSWLAPLQDNPLVEVSAHASSVAGRPLWRLDIGPADAPQIVMAQTPQPSEMLGTWACRAVVDFLISDDPEAKRIRSRHHVTLLPATNPDGTVLGLGVSHPSGRFPYFEGLLTVDHPESALPEMTAVWRLLERERPWLFVEWHGNNWSRRPGHMLLRYRPSLLDEGDTRTRWETFEGMVEQLPNTHHGSWTSKNEGIYQESIGFMAVTHLGGAAIMIKQHDKFALAECERHAVSCFRAAIAAHESVPTGAGSA
ncbi:MAG: hypothetical protein HN849_28165 [Victivallales bacterium]|nr:hypothetical protein [Victivallales bacterium]